MRSGLVCFRSGYYYSRRIAGGSPVGLGVPLPKSGRAARDPCLFHELFRRWARHFLRKVELDHVTSGASQSSRQCAKAPYFALEAWRALNWGVCRQLSFIFSTIQMNKDILQKAANEARGLAIDAVHACKSGHVGLPLGAAEIGAVLYGSELNVNPDEPRWINRDRFVLSAGHGSMFIYGWLHLAGFDLSLDELKNFRQLGSHTPGHPEFGETAGVESTTGPLGQGVGNAVGFAVSQKMAAAAFNTEEHTILDNHIVVLAGDGCIQEGVAHEASSLAGHLKLDNLIVFYDSNESLWMRWPINRRAKIRPTL